MLKSADIISTRSMPSVSGIILIIAGVLILNFFGPGHGESDQKGNEAVTANEK